MLKNTDEKAVIKKITAWVESKPDIRAVILTSSRTKPSVQLDEFSDYDVIFVAQDIKPYRENEDWLDEYGKILGVYRDPVEIRYGYERFINVTQYENGLKIDFTLWPVDLLKHVVAIEKLPDYIDDGYKVLLDKDGLTKGMKTPSYKAFIPKPPTETEYQKFCEGFFYNTPYAAKHIRRGEFFPLKDMLNYLRYEKLRKMLEWKVEIEHEWTIKSGVSGKGLEKYVSPEILKEIEDSWTGFTTEDNWKALFTIINMFGREAREVGKRLGYKYPEDKEKRLLAYLKKVKSGELP
jgi:aminoglycoside 6-adenylyltransferase